MGAGLLNLSGVGQLKTPPVPVPEFVVTFSAVPVCRTISVTSFLRMVGAAQRLGVEVVALSVDGKPLPPETVRAFNSWSAAGCAAHAARAGYFDAWRRLDAVLFPPCPHKIPQRRPRVSKKTRPA